MLGLKTAARKRAKDEAEKPFWISFSDLMTALMVLFLVAMSVSLVAITEKVAAESDVDKREIMVITEKVVSGPDAHKRKIDACMVDVNTMTLRDFTGVVVRGHSIDFGTQALYRKNQHQLDGGAQQTLRRYVPQILQLSQSSICKGVFKRVIVEGFASQSGTYLYNLNLSLQRAERVLCVLLDPSMENALSESERKLVRNLFLVGGSSFNALKPSESESRRVELKLEFLAYGEAHEVILNRPLDEDFKCPLPE